MNCDCKDWKENIEKIDAPLKLQAARSGFLIGYGGKQFRFCPWCSRPLVEPGSEVLAGQARTESAVQQKPDGAPVDTAVQTKTDVADGREKPKPPFFTTDTQHYIPAAGLSVGERVRKRLHEAGWLIVGIFEELEAWQTRDIESIINQEVNAAKRLAPIL